MAEAMTEVKLYNIFSVEDWHDVEFQNGWHDYEALYNKAGWFKDPMGVVHLRGMVSGGTYGEAVFTLPEGNRPARRELFVVLTGSSAAGRVDVLRTGQVNAQVGEDFVSLDGITFRAA